jgi:dihydroneopterin aldolase
MSDIGRDERRLTDERPGRRPDQIEIRGLEVFAHHGVHERERIEGQRFIIDVTMEADTHIAARTDDLGDTVDYGRIVSEVAEMVRTTRYQLLEALAAHIADDVLQTPGVAAAAVRIHKPDVDLPEQVDEVAVTVRRARPTHVT